MPEKETLERAQEDAREGKSASTQAGEFVREEIHHIREGKHGAASPKQAIAIGLSKARRAGVKLPPPKQGKASAKVRQQAKRESAAAGRKASPRRSRARLRVLEREGSEAASPAALSRQAHQASRKRSASERSQAAKKAVRTKGKATLRTAAKKAARTRKQHRKAA